MMLTNILSLALLAAPIIASPLASLPTLEERALDERTFLDTTIKDVINGVVDSTKSLTAAVESFSGKIEDAGPIVTQSTGLLDTITKGTATVQDAHDLTLVGLLEILTPTLNLNKAVEGVSGALIDKKSQFDTLGLSAVVLSQLQDQQKAAQALVNVLLTKLPLGTETLGEILSSPSLEALANAISVFSGKSS